MSTALLKRSLHGLEFSVARRLPMEHIKPGPAFSPGLGGAAAVHGVRGCGLSQAKLFEEAGVVDSVRSTAGPKNG
jgi:hypothetical protein